ncbi:hypothetical protein MAR_005568 [Mya arenaria]|uniref:Uncharacterized protein n=1 Tax=Mya arenaria TaxID=6604 RepID=A0ABY7EZW8_MYAAR|nr:hypothetical protein MAR_005568 [Mya arenaria]
MSLFKLHIANDQLITSDDQWLLKGVHTQRVFKNVDNKCVSICVSQNDLEFNGECPQTFCDRQCADQRLASRITVVFRSVHKGITVTTPQDNACQLTGGTALWIRMRTKTGTSNHILHKKH